MAGQTCRRHGYRFSALASATLAVDPLQDAIDLEDATDTEIITLKKWKQYRVAVNRVDLTKQSPKWPVSPV